MTIPLVWFTEPEDYEAEMEVEVIHAEPVAEFPMPCWDERPINADAAWAAVVAMCG